MKNNIGVILALSLITAAYGADDVVTAVHGTVEKVDSATETITVKTADGAKHTLVGVKDTSIHGADASADAGKDSWHGIAKGSEVVAHYTKRGSTEVAVEVDRVGKGGFTATKGTVEAIDRGGKTIVVKTADGTKETFRLTDHAAKYAGTDIGKGTEKGAEVVVYSTKASGKKVAHFFEHI